MKNFYKKLVIALLPFLVIGCEKQTEETKEPSQQEMIYTDEWEYDSFYHYHQAIDLTKIDVAEHTYSEWEIVSADRLNDRESTLIYKNARCRKCTVCGYEQCEGYEMAFEYLYDFKTFDELPEIKFTTESGTSFATEPTDKTDKPEVTGTYSISNCPDEFKLEASGAMKVRGNQTARFSKKGFRIKFDSKQNLLGLNEGRKYKKWVLLADAKDPSILRSSLGFYLAKHFFENDNVFVSDFVPINLYINDEYWGVYILAEQKEVNEGRINLPKPEENYAGTDIGYCFELDNYASREAGKGEDGDPTFTVEYKPKEISANPEWGSSNVIQHGYTMLSDITNEETQLPYIKNQVELLYSALYYCANYKVPYVIENNEVKKDTTTDLETALSKYFNIDSFVDSFIFNEFICNPDVGYSSFFMSLDMSPTGDKKLRFDCPWDFDSAFGIRKNCMESAYGEYVNRCTNMWLNLFSKLDFFMEKVKTRWHELYEKEFVFHNASKMISTYANKYEAEYEKNFERWPTCIGKNSEAKSELTYNYANISTSADGLLLLLRWFGDRVKYLDKKFKL